MKKPIAKKGTLLRDSIYGSFKMLDPRIQVKNPAMFVTYVGAIYVTGYVLFKWNSFDLQIALWLWFTVLFANFALSLAEGRGKAQAAFLRNTQTATFAQVLKGNREEKIASSLLKKGDIFICRAGELIAADGEVVEGIATVDESAITGESAPVIRESGGDRSAVTAGTKVVSDHLTIKVTQEAGGSFLDRIIYLIEVAKRQPTPNEVALHIVLSALTLIFLLTIFSLKIFSDYLVASAKQSIDTTVTIPVLIALLVCLIPTTISALLSAVGIAGMDRLIRCNVIAKSGRAVEAAGDINLLLLDKTGTITMGNRCATAFIPAKGVPEKELAELAQLASLADETPEGRSIVVLAKTAFGIKPKSLPSGAMIVPFSASTKMSGVDLRNEKGEIDRQIRKGAKDAMVAFIHKAGGTFSVELEGIINEIAIKGGTPLLVAENNKIIGVIHLKDVIKGGIKERFLEMRRMGIRTVMITGDNQLTAAAIAAEAGVDDYVAEATPEIKLELIQHAQSEGRLVAMTGDGTNDAPALAQADVGVAMNTGTQSSREAGNMVDLDSNPTKLLAIVEVGKQMLITRGALTTFSVANDVAKYFAIIPAIFTGLYASEGASGPLSVLNIMNLQSPETAILSAVIFNALIIILLIPLALRGAKVVARSANEVLQNNILLYGVGGLIAPFIGIKLIDMVLGIL